MKVVTETESNTFDLSINYPYYYNIDSSNYFNVSK